MEENGRQHFMTRRFDRLPGGEKLHMQSLCAMAHFDFNMAGAYSYNPQGAWTASHQMTMNGKRENFTLADFKACAKAASMKRGRAEAIVAEVQASVAKWPAFA